MDFVVAGLYCGWVFARSTIKALLPEGSYDRILPGYLNQIHTRMVSVGSKVSEHQHTEGHLFFACLYFCLHGLRMLSEGMQIVA